MNFRELSRSIIYQYKINKKLKPHDKNQYSNKEFSLEKS